MLNQDMVFLSRVMGAPVPAGLPAEKLWSWVGAAMANPEKRAIGLGRLAGLIEMLPTAEDAARTPVEMVRRDAGAPERQDVRSSAGALLGMLVGGVYLRDGECPCESGLVFADCHGRDEP